MFSFLIISLSGGRGGSETKAHPVYRFLPCGGGRVPTLSTSSPSLSSFRVSSCWTLGSLEGRWREEGCLESSSQVLASTAFKKKQKQKQNQIVCYYSCDLIYIAALHGHICVLCCHDNKPESRGGGVGGAGVTR
uniref:Uncharacterized protein n=1 Tax=Gasterosteus aculeatus TaxID=69293 RepID=G3PGA0_GASAC